MIAAGRGDGGVPGPGAAAGDDAQVALDVSLLGRSYKFACKASERSDLVDAVAFLDRRMRAIRDTGKVAGAERIAIMAALNIAHEMQRAKREAAGAAQQAFAPATFDGTDARRRIDAMCAEIDAVLAGEGDTA